MLLPVLDHPWDLTPKTAREVQLALAPRVEQKNRLEKISLVLGTDVGFEENGKITRAAVVCLSFPELLCVEKVLVKEPTTFPYIPGLLSFREIPALLAALRRLNVRPDVILCDGQGTAHPRRFGIACHLGVLLNLPTVGVAKSILVGAHDPIEPEKGSWKPLVYKGDVVGAALRTRSHKNPVYVSPGHGVSLEKSIEVVLGCVTRYRLPETTRHAHRLASQR